MVVPLRQWKLSLTVYSNLPVRCQLLTSELKILTQRSLRNALKISRVAIFLRMMRRHEGECKPRPKNNAQGVDRKSAGRGFESMGSI
jgi:hypothetical protein